LGQRLWDSIPQMAKDLLVEATVDQPCRLKISSNSPVIDDLPWEWLNDGTIPFALRPGIRLVRSVPCRLALPPMSVMPPIRVLLVITNPKDERLLQSWREIDAIRPGLTAPFFDLKVLEEPTWEALTAALQDELHIVHYIGHAGIDRGEGNLILHDWRNVSHWISGPELSQVLPLSVKLMCLSTCFTAPNYQILGLPRLAHASATYRLPTMVANSYPVEENSVRRFWEVFYGSLVRHGGNVNEAFHEAQLAVMSTPGSEADWGSFSLVIRDQSGEVMRMEPAGMRSATRQTEEIQAQLASRLANDLATRLLTFGAESPETVERHFEHAAASASNLTKNLY
jgi:hypothetical protein